MRRYILSNILLWLILAHIQQIAAAQRVDTLVRDSVMLSTGIEMAFKGGTVYRTDSRGLVMEGTPAHDIDLWTTGPMILFSSAEPVRLDAGGRALSGVLGANTLIQCADNQFREFAKDYRIGFNENGLLRRGTPVHGIPFSIEDQEFVSQPMMPVSFYPNGRVHVVHPQSNIRLNTSSGGRIVISSESWIELSEGGKFLRGKLYRKYMGHNRGETIRMDSDGNIY
ncbi:MAG: hypothetical protein MJZ66_06875 [Bacteroidales bacterium]|nr:hypothetical protein [Bacteroidales bacterium]